MFLERQWSPRPHSEPTVLGPLHHLLQESATAPQKGPLGFRGEEGDTDWEEVSSSFPKGCHSFLDAISRGMMPPCQLPSKSWHLQPVYDAEQWNQESRAKMCLGMCVSTCTYLWPMLGIHSLLHSSSQQILVGQLLYSSNCVRFLGYSRNKTDEVLPSWSL